MEARMKKCRLVSPERAKVWHEKSPKYHQNKKVAVVCYLCRNRQLEHPHFIEVPLSSPDGLYLRDVIERLNVLRGRGMASLYSWSCKRSYKNGFVWHDLSDDDLIVPAHANDYVLKGSLLFDESNSDHLALVVTSKKQNLEKMPEPTSSRPQDSELSTRDGKNCAWSGPLSLTESKTDASTQTEENVSRPKTRETCTRGVSTDDGSSESGCHNSYQNHDPEISENSASSLPSSSSASSSGGKTETLESLVRADVNKFQISSHARFKASNVLMQLISCGSISVKDHSFEIIPTYRPRISNSKFASPFFPSRLILGELDCLSENPRLLGERSEDRVLQWQPGTN